jgi:hypothetical protein
VVLPVVGATTLGAAGGVRVVCTEAAGQNLRLVSARLTAVKVGTLNP